MRCNVTLGNDFRHIWHPKVKQHLIFENTSPDHLRRILKLWLGSGWCSFIFRFLLLFFLSFFFSDRRFLLLRLVFKFNLKILIMRSPIIWFFAVLFLLSNTYGTLNTTFFSTNLDNFYHIWN